MKKNDFYCNEAILGNTKIDKLYESDNVLAFYHTKPSYKVHIVITPKNHIDDLQTVKDNQLEIIKEIFKVARDLSKKLDKESGLRFVTNIGKFQDDNHLHFHLVEGKFLGN